MSKRGFFMYWFTPFGRMRDAAQSLTGAIKGAREAIASQVPAATSPEDLDERDVRRIEDGRLRFEAMYEMHRWTPQELATQKKALKAGKVACLAMAAFVFVLSLGILMFSPFFIQLFAAPLGLLLTVLSLSQAFRYALFEAQIDLRCFISAKDFLAREDFWRRVLG